MICITLVCYKSQSTFLFKIYLLYCLVLVAHNGFAFDFLFLMAEIKRRNLEESLGATDLWFADTLYDAKRVS